MRKIVFNFLAFFVLIGVTLVLPNIHQSDVLAQNLTATVKIDQTALGFEIPNLADILTFAIRAFFVIAGLVALVYLLLGAFSWITSGGEEDAVKKAREKITAAIIGVILIVVVLAIIVTLEQIVFQGTVCFGVSCAATIPNIVTPCCKDGDGNVIPATAPGTPTGPGEQGVGDVNPPGCVYCAE